MPTAYAHGTIQPGRKRSWELTENIRNVLIFQSNHQTYRGHTYRNAGSAPEQIKPGEQVTDGLARKVSGLQLLPETLALSPIHGNDIFDDGVDPRTHRLALWDRGDLERRRSSSKCQDDGKQQLSANADEQDRQAQRNYPDAFSHVAGNDESGDAKEADQKAPIEVVHLKETPSQPLLRTRQAREGRYPQSSEIHPAADMSSCSSTVPSSVGAEMRNSPPRTLLW
ncbi:hypothetical protein LTR53_000284 [Teratosphaeriaceae sp. CCFEE 6253]|nr:hypothetical protein LTR53_000284 [Teratosphaeriaceae sp. CCFEE 6253]